MSDPIDARLREAARLSAVSLDAEGPHELARRAREARSSAVVDMSGDGIDARLHELAELSQLCASLATGPADAEIT